MRIRRTSPALAILALALLALSAGCDAVGKQTGPNGDASGEHLLVFATDRPGTAGGFDVWLYDLDAAGFRALPNLNGATSESEPVISDDGQLIAFARPGGAGGSDVFVYGRRDEAMADVPNLNSAADETHPRFAHDSRYLAFVRDSAGFKRIRLYEPVGDSLVSLRNMTAHLPYHDDQPAPDLHGERIAFTSDRDGRNHVYLWNRTGGIASAPALAGDSLDAEPSLSSNGRWLAFASNRSGGAGGWDVYLYDVSTAALVRVPRLNTAGEERHPSVSDDGRRILFQARATAADDWDLFSWTMSDSTVRQPAGLSNATANDFQPNLRWR
ncbi:MAG: PD40 domain-containing protein [Candidatus Eisenbacteria bacterium]|nr:PD40 domain-containing protein [Candidatus Eisenbacteria bacterium]